MLQSFQERFYLNFIADDRWKYLVNGLKVTLTITFFALIIGVVLGFLVAIVRSTYDKTGKLKILNLICKVYLTVIRDQITTTQMQVEITNGEILRTQEALATAQADEAKQYEDMKTRIKYMYETGNATLLEMLFSAETMTDFLNK